MPHFCGKLIALILAIRADHNPHAMSSFRKFKLPQLLRKGYPEDEIIRNIQRFECNEFPVKEIIGQGAFADVYTTDYKGPGDAKCETVVIKKMLQVLDKEEKKLFFKTVKLLINELQTTFHRIKWRKWGKWRGLSFPDFFFFLGGGQSFPGLSLERKRWNQKSLQTF